MKVFLTLIVFLLFWGSAYSQSVDNKLFALHNVIAGDSTYGTAEKQVRYLCGLVYQGLEINGVDRFDTMEEALAVHALHVAYFYVKVK